ncbi:hypothetical protein WOLCODRAFT_167863 [Wolfiporia cocos MD-104 SS10]|uniref:Uncharacterized protein n=1 Tax=Wolfiporia cocos (strain MD-104) TaxID=742152 RepID=A0A2H3JAG0_WOLCO|nr:hypothetical protein WOLCODRAFT_167863 [Wolfiporia cocos MD-104 SS10]
MLSLGHSIIAAMRAVELLIVVTFNQDKGTAYRSAHGGAYSKSGSVKYALRVAEQTLIRSRNEAREQLGRIFDEMDLEQRELGRHAAVPKQVLDGSLVMIALLQMAQEMRHALQIAERTYTQYEESHVRLWYPRVTLSWLGVPPGPFISDDADATIQLRVTETQGTLWVGSATPSEVNLTSSEAREGLAEVGYGGKLPSGLTYAMLSSSKEHEPRKGESR